MATLSISAAARATGIHRVTMQKYVKEGKVTATKDNRGNPQIDVAELMRVFGPLKSDGNIDSSLNVQLEQQEATPATSPQKASWKPCGSSYKRLLSGKNGYRRSLKNNKSVTRFLKEKCFLQGRNPKRDFWGVCSADYYINE